MNFIKNILKSGKDSVLSAAVKRIVTYYIREYGKMLNFKLDSVNKSINIEVLLKGEDSPIKITLYDYELISEGDEAIFSFERIEASREWMNILAANMLEEKDGKKIFRLPAEQAKLLNIVM